MGIIFKSGIKAIVGDYIPPVPTLTATPTLTPTLSLTSTPTPTLTSTPTNTPTPTPTLTSTPTPTLTSTQTPTLTSSSTNTPTPTPTLTSTQTPTLTSSSTRTPTPTPTLTSSSTRTPTPTPTASSSGGGYTNTAEIYYDPGNSSSYPGSGTSLTNIGTAGNVTGTLGTLSGVAYESGTASGAFNLDGVSDKITFGQYNFGTAITVTAWVYPRSEFSINTIIANSGANLTTNGFRVGWNSWNTTNQNMIWEAGNGSAGGTQSTANNVITNNTWQHIAYVFDQANRTIKFFKNGVEQSTSGTPVASIGMNNTNWYIGAIGGNSYYMNANLGQFRVYKSLKVASDLLAEFNGTKSRYGL
jgi:hypothetical protein